MLIKQKGVSLSRNLAHVTFWRIASNVLNEGKSAIPVLFNGPEVLSFAADKAKLFASNFSKNSNLDELGIFLIVFPSRINLKTHNILLTPKLVKKGYNQP